MFQYLHEHQQNFICFHCHCIVLATLVSELYIWEPCDLKLTPSSDQVQQGFGEKICDFVINIHSISRTIVELTSSNQVQLYDVNDTP